MSYNFKQLSLCEIYFVAVLTSWQERFPYDATYHRLALALKHPTVGRVDLAAKYCGPQLARMYQWLRIISIYSFRDLTVGSKLIGSLSWSN